MVFYERVNIFSKYFFGLINLDCYNHSQKQEKQIGIFLHMYVLSKDGWIDITYCTDGQEYFSGHCEYFVPYGDFQQRRL